MVVYVYELVNLMGTVEYVGRTKEPKERFRNHLRKPIEGVSGIGLFYGRQDLIMNLVKGFDTVKEANFYEGELKLSYGMDWTEEANYIKNGLPAPRAILAYDLDGNFVGEFYSSEFAATKLKSWGGNIRNVLNGKFKQTKGYTFKYKTI